MNNATSSCLEPVEMSFQRLVHNQVAQPRPATSCPRPSRCTFSREDTKMEDQESISCLNLQSRSPLARRKCRGGGFGRVVDSVRFRITLSHDSFTPSGTAPSLQTSTYCQILHFSLRQHVFRVLFASVNASEHSNFYWCQVLSTLATFQIIIATPRA